MAKNVGGFAQKAARSRQKRDYSVVKYVKSIRSEKSGNWRFQEQIIRVNDGETVAAALKRVDLELHPAPEKIPVIQPEVPPAPVEETHQEEATEKAAPAEAVAEPEAKAKPKTETVTEETAVVETETELETVRAESAEPATEDKAK